MIQKQVVSGGADTCTVDKVVVCISGQQLSYVQSPHIQICRTGLYEQRDTGCQPVALPIMQMVNNNNTVAFYCFSFWTPTSIHTS